MDAALLAVSVAPTYTKDHEVMEAIHAACVKLKCPELFSRITMRWAPIGEKLGNGKDFIGCATYATNVVSLSLRYWPSMTPAQRLDTIRHEVCHLAAFFKFGRKGCGHGPLWRNLCVIVGCTPRARSKNIELPPELRRERKTRRKQGYCKCPGGCEISTVAANRMAEGWQYTCGKCKGDISLRPPKAQPVAIVQPPTPKPLAACTNDDLILPQVKPVKMSANDLGLLKVGTRVLGFYGEKGFEYVKLNGGWVPANALNDNPMTNGFFAQMPDAFAIVA